jgi:hypothetical protein
VVPLRQLLPMTPVVKTPSGLSGLRAAIEDTSADASDEASGGSPDAVDLWTFGGDQAPPATGWGPAKPEAAVPSGSGCSSRAPGLDRYGARYDPAVSRWPAPDDANASPSRGAQR